MRWVSIPATGKEGAGADGLQMMVYALPLRGRGPLWGGVDLLTEGVDVNKAADDGATPLFIASQGSLWWCRYCCQGGVDVNRAMNNGATPLFIASGKGAVRWCRYCSGRASM